ncbi:DUF6069 family protein [Micromonospora sp. WMMD980]|uniref:DUF6069 family protein n=1 Tax=Micromonospora sp. WMMD980 TaxID=3016088 RepID=UPI002416E9D8|nr:DUF6069 family protein [Micromonospora sp. WMMD980]MDG4800734.1 DUF6069 family protein [Micromonospora sp. WMMD980]
MPATTVRPARRRDRLLTVLAATAATLVGWAVAVPLAGVELTVRGGGGEQRVGPLAVAVSTLLAGLAGWALLALLDRFTGRARTVWTAVAAVVLLLSLLGPLTGGVGRPAMVTLVALHLLAGAVLVPGLRRTAVR